MRVEGSEKSQNMGYVNLNYYDDKLGSFPLGHLTLIKDVYSDFVGLFYKR